MGKLRLIIIFFALLVSCQDIEKVPRPENLIAEDKMVEILTELSLLHGARSYNKGLMIEKGIDPYPYLLEKYKIDSTQLVKSNNYYATNPKQYEQIYEKVKLRLESLLAQYDSIREQEERKMDSIREMEEKKLDSIRKANPNDSLLNAEEELDSLQLNNIRKSLPPPVSRNRTLQFERDTIQ